MQLIFIVCLTGGLQKYVKNKMLTTYFDHVLKFFKKTKERSIN